MPSSQFHLEVRRKTLRFCAPAAILLAFLTSFLPNSKAQSPSLRLRRITYLTTNLDSSIRSFLRDGFVFGHGEYHPYGPFEVTLPAGHTVALMGSDSTDTTKWQTRALGQFSNHICKVEFETSDAKQIVRALDSIGVSHSAIDDGSITLLGFAPLEISFAQSREAIAPDLQNGYSRISWLVLTANDSSEARMRKVFAALKLRQFHEGCCDYWTLGPVDSRTAIRFELPPDQAAKWAPTQPKPHPEVGWLSIEDGGVIYAY